MNIQVNGHNQQFDEPISVTTLLKKLGYQDRFVAVAINSHCIPKSRYQQTQVAANDEIEILAPMAGG